MRHPSDRTALQKSMYWLGRTANYLTYRALWRLEVRGRENVPLTGGVILASNHLSLADPPLVGACCPRTMHFFAKEELFRVPVLGWAIRQVNAFPVKRFDHDVGAFKRAQLLLRDGEALVLFPEGTRSRSGELGKAKPGVGMLAFKARVPVVPVCILNTNRLPSLVQVKVWFGPPIAPPAAAEGKPDYQGFSDRVLRGIADLKSKMIK